MPGVGFPVAVVRGVPVVTAPEEIDISNAAALRAALLEGATYGRGAVVADMSGTQFCDSAGLHVLLRAHKRAQAKGDELLLVIPTTIVLRVFAITGIDRMIPNFSSLEDALAAHLPPAELPAATPDDVDRSLTG
jgi:anti-sigma B factor antagonist